MKNIWLDGMLGLVVGDALGVPVQFLYREEIRNRKEGPVSGMEGYGTFNLPEGTWSDDSSMALATLDSIIHKGGVDAVDIMENFCQWELKGKYTPFGKAFDQGLTCSSAIYKYVREKDITTCGNAGEGSNGNGSLMRILPVCIFYAMSNGVSDEEIIRNVHIVSGLTHNHLRSKMACGLYYYMVKAIVDRNHDATLKQILQSGIDNGLKYYGKNPDNLEEMTYFGRLFHLDELEKANEDTIRSSGYVIDTIEAAVWCLITTNTFRDCLLKAVNLGDDTDTVAAIAGGLAGLYYGMNAIPEDWLNVIKKREYIEDMCERGLSPKPSDELMNLKV